MGIQLFEHNKSAYDTAIQMLKEKGRAAIIHPTGTGKSFIGFKLCEDNPTKKICWLSPSDYIFKTQIENLEKASGGYTPNNVCFFTYAKLMNMTDAEIKEIEPDYIILDEFHRCGAEQWGIGVNTLLSIYKDCPILGLSATAVRYLDNQRDMSAELFYGNVASEMTLGEAIVKGILNPPKYVLSILSYPKEIANYQKRIENLKNPSVRDEAERYLEALRRSLDKAEGMEEIFSKHISDRTGKYIVFCSNAEHMSEMTRLATEWFSKIDIEPHIYTAYSNDPETSKAFLSFKKDCSEHLKLLYCIDMLNEGIHIDDISGVILLRPTVSPIIYKQQIGRALAAGKNNNAVIFDVVMNIESLYSIGAIEEEMQIATSYYRSLGENKFIVNEEFKVIDEVKNCRELFNKLENVLTASWNTMYSYAEQYYKDNGDLEVPKRFVTADGLNLGAWITTQRRVYNSKTSGTLTDKQISKLEAIGMRWASISDISWEKHYAAAKEYYSKYGNLKVSIDAKSNDGIKLGRWLAQLRTYRKSGIKCAFLTRERIELLDKIGMIWDVPDYMFEKNYSLCLEYYRKHGNLDVATNYITEDGTRLGRWVQSIRCASKSSSSMRAQLTDLQKSRLDEIGFIWDSKGNALWEKSYEALINYKKQYGNIKVPVSYVTEDGIRLGRWVRHQRDAYRTKMSDDRKRKLKELGFSRCLADPWEQKYKLVKEYYDEHGNADIPKTYISDGVWIGRWLKEQVSRMNKEAEVRSKVVKSLTDEQIAKLRTLGICDSAS